MLPKGQCRPLNKTIAHRKEKTELGPRGPKGIECCSHDILAKQQAKEHAHSTQE